MRVGIIQSNYLPWRGYFDFIAGVDLFIFHDDLQYTKGDWRNRNRLKTQNGPKWLTVPVKQHMFSQLICDTEIDYSTDWRNSHINRFKACYGKTAFFSDALDILNKCLLQGDPTLSQLNIRLIRHICNYLQIETPLSLSMDYAVSGSKTERLIALLKKAGATVYLSGPSAKDYLDEHLFHENNIKLEYKSYDYKPYPQLWGPFEGAVSVMDLIANCGRQSKEMLRSLTPNKVVIP